MAVTMKKEDQDALAAAGAAWNSATTQAEKDAAHAQAEAIRAKYNYSGGADGSQYIPTTTTSTTKSNTSGNSQYTAVGKGSDYYAGQQMSASDQALLKSYGDAYNNATTDAERQAAHAAAEALRAQYGYSGGGDGSEYIQIVQPENTGFTYGSAPTYTDQYSQRIDEMLNQILNRDAFSYNAAEDDLYQQYRDQYTREGQRAMQDTLGQVAARTGGMASSYAVSAAQQQNNYYMQQLSDKIPELYQLAYQMYLDDIDLQVQDLGLLQGASDTAYNRYRDTMADWRDDRDFAYGMYRDDIGDSQWQSSFDRDVFESDRDYNYGVGRDAIEDSRYTEKWEYQLAQDALAQQNWEAEQKAKAAAKVSPIEDDDDTLEPLEPAEPEAYEGNEGLTADQVKALQAALGVETDGLYGDASKKAAGGLSAKEAYNKYVTGKAQVETTGDEFGNNHGDSWIYVPGMGRLTWKELEDYVDSGKVKESLKDGKYWYTQAR